MKHKGWCLCKRSHFPRPVHELAILGRHYSLLPDPVKRRVMLRLLKRLASKDLLGQDGCFYIHFLSSVLVKIRCVVFPHFLSFLVTAD